MLLNNPIFKREFNTAIRSFKTVFLLVSYLLILAALLLLLWPGGGIHSVASADGKKLFTIFFSINMALIILLVPAFSATSITFEKENHTYPALFTTLMTPLEIMSGKLTASISVMILFIIFSLPISSLCALTGGISIVFMFKVTSVLLLTTFSYGVIGLACSSLCSKSSTAIIMNYVIIMIFAGVSWLPDILLGDLTGCRNILQAIRSFSPFDTLFFLIYPEHYVITSGTSAVTGVLNPYAVFTIFSIIISVIALVVFNRNILRPCLDKGDSLEIYTDSSKSIKRKLSWPFYLIDPLKRKKNIGRFANPVFVAEMRSKLFANPKFIVRTVSIIFILSMTILVLVATQYAVNFDTDMVNMVSIVFQIGVVAMLAPSVSSGLITDEITSGTLTAMRMTPLSPLQMVIGKLKATFFYALVFIVSSFFIIFAMAYLINQTVFPEDSFIFSVDWWHEAAKLAAQKGWLNEVWNTYWRIVTWTGILLLSTVTFLTGGLFASSISKKTSVATALSYSITATICLVSLFPVVIGDKLSYEASRAILSVNPIISAIQITGAAFHEYPDLWKSNIAVLLSLSGLFLIGATISTWHLFTVRK